MIHRLECYLRERKKTHSNRRPVMKKYWCFKTEEVSEKQVQQWRSLTGFYVECFRTREPDESFPFPTYEMHFGDDVEKRLFMMKFGIS